MTPSDTVGALLSAGPLGAIIVALGFAYMRQAKVLKETQESRVADAKKVADTLLAINDRWHATIGQLTTAVNELRASVTRR